MKYSTNLDLASVQSAAHEAQATDSQGGNFSGADPVFIELADPESADGLRLLSELSTSLFHITGSTGTAFFDVNDVKVDRSCFVVARSALGQAIGCGALRPLDHHTVELKRMYAQAGTKGVGAALLVFLEDKAIEFGYTQLWLATRLVNQRAVNFYRKNGFTKIAAFGQYINSGQHVCYAKSLEKAGELRS